MEVALEWTDDRILQGRESVWGQKMGEYASDKVMKFKVWYLQSCNTFSGQGLEIQIGFQLYDFPYPAQWRTPGITDSLLCVCVDPSQWPVKCAVEEPLALEYKWSLVEQETNLP